MELKTTEEFVREAHSAACSTWKTKIEKEFPELFKTELAIGKWYYNQEYGIVIYLKEHKYDDAFNGYGFNKDKEWFSCDKSVNIFAEYCNREATHEEIESALIAEAEKRGFGKARIKFMDLETGKKSETYGDFMYLSKEGTLKHLQTTFFKDGIWATIIPEEKTTISKEKALKIIAKKLKVSPENIEIK